MYTILSRAFILFCSTLWISSNTVATVSVSGNIPSYTFSVDTLENASTGSVLAGTMPGDFHVDNRGAANYVVPLQVPPGVNGMQPDLSISYDSQAGNGVMGIGWSLNTGVDDVITRGRTIYARDGYSDGVDYSDDNSEDRLYLNGRRLIAVNGDYGKSGCEYRIEIGGFDKIVQFGSGTTSSFVLTKPNGVVYTYGGTTDSRLVLRLNSTTTNNQVTEWRISSVKDLQGNEIAYTYETYESGSTTKIYDNTLYLSEVKYGSSGNYRFRIAFGYSTGRSDNIRQYSCGYGTRVSQKLDSIRVFGVGDDVAYVTYILDYDSDNVALSNNGKSGRLRLASVMAMFNDGTYTNKTTFTWSNKSASYLSPLARTWHMDTGSQATGYYAAQDVDGDNMPELVTYFNDYIWVYKLWNNSSAFQLQTKALADGEAWDSTVLSFGDVDSDGTLDIIAGINNKMQVYRMVNGSLKPYYSGFQTVFTSLHGSNSYAAGNYMYELLDLNNDGRNQLVATWHVNGNLVINYNSGYGMVSDRVIQGYVRDYSRFIKGIVPQIQDRDGDGVSDFFFFPEYESVTRNLKISVGSASSSDNGYAAGSDVTYSTTFEKYSDVIVCDINRDGVSDIVSLYEEHSSPYLYGNTPLYAKVRLGTGKGGYALTQSFCLGTKNSLGMYVPSGGTIFNNRWKALVDDFTGDGIPDLSLYTYNDEQMSKGVTLHIWKGTGVSFFTSSYYANTATPDNADINYVCNFSSVDRNQDGVADLCLIAKDGNILTCRVFESRGEHPDVLVGITDGLGRKTEVKYKSSHDSTVYTRGATGGIKYPIQEARDPIYVVSDVYNDFGDATSSFGNFGDPVFDSTGKNKLRDVYVISYQYSGGRTDLSGRGFLGFQSMVTLDRQTNLFKYQFLAQSFPMTGLTVREHTYKATSVICDTGGNVTSVSLRLLDSRDNVVRYDEVQSPATATPWGPLFPYMPYSCESRWEDGAAHYTGITNSKTLFGKSIPSGAYSTVGVFTWYDEQSFAGSVGSLPSLPGAFNDNETAPSASGFDSVTGTTNAPVGFVKADFAGLSMPCEITYGNVRKVLVDYGNDGQGGLSGNYQTETVNEYYLPDSTNSNRSDLLKRTQTYAKTPVFTTWNAGPVTSFTYSSTGLPMTKTVDCASSDSTKGFIAVTNPNSSLSTMEAYAFTTSGLLQSVTLSGGGSGYYDIGGSRVTQRVTAWDSTGRFPKITVDVLGRSTTANYDAFGRVVETTDYNGQHVCNTYDALGRVTKSKDMLRGLNSVSRYGYTTDGATDYTEIQTVTPPSEAVTGLKTVSKYYVCEAATVTSPVTTYYDRLGRKIRTIREGFANQKTITDFVYDRDGRVVATSNPYTEANTSSKVWTLTTYDDLGRVKTVKTPTQTVTTNTYSGRLTQVGVKAIDRNLQVTSTLVNARGETVAVWDSGNTTTVYAQPGNGTPSLKFILDGLGRVCTTSEWQGGSNYVDVLATYDALGHQTRLVDPDKGTWNYVYNALGQLKRQMDANGAVTAVSYDWLGRQLTRTVTQSDGSLETADSYYYEKLSTLPSGLPTAQRSHLVEDSAQQWIGAVQRETVIQTNSPLNYENQRSHYYNRWGQAYLDLYNIDGKWFYLNREFDQYGRVVNSTYYWRPPSLENDANTSAYVWQSYGINNVYDARSYMTSVYDSQNHMWWQIGDTGYDWMDRPVLFQKGGTGSYWTMQEYDACSGLLLKTTTGPKNTSGNIEWTVQRNEYKYDGLGNLTWRQDVKRNYVEETFSYDDRNRLTNSTLTGACSYSDSGNIQTKKNVAGTSGSFVYGSSKSHAVTSAFGYSMEYDANGNVSSRKGNGETWAFSWTGFDKPRWMAKSTSSYVRGDAFAYGPDHMRVVELEFDSMTMPSSSAPSGWKPLHYTNKIIYVSGGGMELDYSNSVTSTASSSATWKLGNVRVYIPSPSGNVGSAELKPDATSASEHKYLVYHYDRLGSIQAITALGETSQSLPSLYASDAKGRKSLYGYDAWGQRCDASDWRGAASSQSTYTWGWNDPTTTTNEDDLIPRGFTGHEMLDNLGLIHANGRIYDPLLSRFMSADPMVQAPYNLQNYNRYSYCMNNPLGYTDPSGYFWDPDSGWWGRTEWGIFGGDIAEHGQDRAVQYFSGLNKGAIEGLKGVQQFVEHPVESMNAAADAFGTTAGRIVYDTDAYWNDFKSGASELANNPELAGRVIGNVETQIMAFDAAAVVVRSSCSLGRSIALGDAPAVRTLSGYKALPMLEETTAATKSLVTGYDEAVFWSGIGKGGASKAANWATQNGGATLESTLSSRGISLPAWDASNPAIVAAWRQASIDFASGAKGNVRVLQGDTLRIDAIWRDEFNALQTNPNVNSIKAINPDSGAEIMLWSK